MFARPTSGGQGGLIKFRKERISSHVGTYFAASNNTIVEFSVVCAQVMRND